MNNAIFRRLERLESLTPSIPSFAEFEAEWEYMDDLSRSLYQCAVACPQLVEASDTIRGYLKRLNITSEPFDLNELVQSLTSDDI